MATDPPSADRRSAPCPDDPTSDLVAQVHDHSRAVIDAALDELAESLLLARLRSLPQHTARLKRLFGTPGEDP